MDKFMDPDFERSAQIPALSRKSKCYITYLTFLSTVENPQTSKLKKMPIKVATLIVNA